MIILQCDYCNQGHLDKIDHLDYRKVTIHYYISRKLVTLCLIHLPMKQMF